MTVPFDSAGSRAANEARWSRPAGSTDPTDRQLLIEAWNSSTAKPPHRRTKDNSQALGRGNLAKFAAWSVSEFGSTFVFVAMGWDETDLRRLLSTGFGESTAARAHPKTVQARLGKATDQQRAWNDGRR